MSPCCSCSEILNEQTGRHFCGCCGATVPETVSQNQGNDTMTDALRASDNEAAKVAVAPRVTLDDIEARIAGEYYIRANEATTTEGAVDDGVSDALACLTICILVMRNGFTVTGESACASPANFNAELGRKFAREQAVRKVWAFEGYALRSKLAGV